MYFMFCKAPFKAAGLSLEHHSFKRFKALEERIDATPETSGDSDG
jgi:hypothetical protein